MSYKKLIAIVLSGCLCVGAMGTTVLADVIGSTSKSTTGGKKATLVAERTYMTPATGGSFGYRYVTSARFEENIKAAGWTIDATFRLPDRNVEIAESTSMARGCYISQTLASTETQYVGGNFKATATSPEYGSVIMQLNVAY